MNGPQGASPDYLAQIAQTLGGAPPPNAGPIMLGQPVAGAPPLAQPPPGPNMSPMPPPAPPPMNLASTPAPAPPAGPPAAPPPARPRSFLEHIAAAGSFTAPAKETELRGPTLRAAQGERNAATLGAIKAVTERSEETAAGDMAIALDQERKAGIREDAANYTAAERNEEMVQRQADFDQSTKAMSEAGQIDQSRFWSDASAGGKIGMLASLFLGSLAEAKGGHNTGLDAINRIREQDIKAQEFAYHATRDTANAKQTAFSMAMQKYNNVDAARAAARVAAIDVTQAQFAQRAAVWKGTEAANRAQMAIASLEDEKMQQIAQGIMFAPSRQVAVGGQWRDPRTGMTYNDTEAKGIVAKMDERQDARERIDQTAAADIVKDRAKAEAERGAGGLGKAGRENLALEQAKAQLELDANLKSINAAKSDVDAIAKGGSLGNSWAHNPAWVPGATGAKQDANAREAYNRRVMMAVAASFKLSTDANEPKRKEMLEHFAEPFTVLPSDNKAMVLTRMNALTKQLEDSAASRGAEAPALPASLQFHDGGK